MGDKLKKGWLVLKGYPKFIIKYPILLKRFFAILFAHGPYKAIQNAYDFLQIAGLKNLNSSLVGSNDSYCPAIEYNAFVKINKVDGEKLKELKDKVKLFKLKPKISIITPVYDIDCETLKTCLDSVSNQIYENWQFCLANGSRDPKIKKVLDDYASKDKRVKIINLEKNLGISGNSNVALKLADGEFVGFLDHDDELSSDALFEVVKLIQEKSNADVIYSDEDKINFQGQYCLPHFKPDWCPDLLLGMQYLGHLVVIRRKLISEINGFRPKFDGAQDHDLLLRITELTTNIYHIPKILYHWRMMPSSTSYSLTAKPYCYEKAKKVIEDAIVRRGLNAKINFSYDQINHIRYKFNQNILVSIIVPTKDKPDFLEKCIKSILKKTSYKNYEIIIVDNNSKEQKTKELFEKLKRNSAKVKITSYNQNFNYSKINNYAASLAVGGVLVFLNNDTEVINEGWLTALIEQAQRKEVGAVGCKLLFTNFTIQHAGVIFDKKEMLHVLYASLPKNNFYSSEVIRNYSAVTGACLAIRKDVFQEINGFDEIYEVPLSDIDLCFTLRQKGYLIVYTPLAQLYHLESATRGLDIHTEDKKRFLEKWEEVLEKPDPYYNINLSTEPGKIFHWRGY